MAQAYEVVRKKRRAKENERAKEVETDGHGKAIHGHELHLHDGHPLVLPLG